MEINLKYPIILAHGMGFRDDKKFGYWGRIADVLRNAGCIVELGNQESCADVETNGRILCNSIDRLLEKTGAKKVNIIAHSKGGLDSRYAISSLGYSHKVASLTTLATPHNGSETIDKLLKFPDFFVRTVSFFGDLWCLFLGDKTPNTYKTIHSFRTELAREFNEQNPNIDGVYYQSYAFVMRKCFADFFLWIPYLVVSKIEGDNDGLLPPKAVMWGNFKGTYKGNGNRGISHLDEIDFRRRPFRRKHNNDCKDSYSISDITELYLDIARDLQKRGF